MSIALLSQAAAAVLAGVFAWAGIVKLRAPERWRKDLLVYRLGRPLRAVGWLLLPWVELGVPIAVLVGRSRLAAALAAGLAFAFSVAIVRARILVGTDQLACGCFGGHATRDYRILLLRNVLLAGLALYILVRPAPGISIVSGLPAGLLLGALGVIAAVWMLRQVRLRGYGRRARSSLKSPEGSATGSQAGVSPGQKPGG